MKLKRQISTNNESFPPKKIKQITINKEKLYKWQIKLNNKKNIKKQTNYDKLKKKNK